MNNDSAFDIEAQRLLDQRIAQVQRLRISDISALPEASGEDLIIAGQKCSLTIYRQRTSDDQLLVTVQLGRPSLAGLVSFHRERGLVFSRDGSVREATPEELAATGG